LGVEGLDETFAGAVVEALTGLKGADGDEGVADRGSTDPDAAVDADGGLEGDEGGKGVEEGGIGREEAVARGGSSK
jgi:hypothetical protein